MPPYALAAARMSLLLTIEFQTGSSRESVAVLSCSNIFLCSSKVDPLKVFWIANRISLSSNSVIYVMAVGDENRCN